MMDGPAAHERGEEPMPPLGINVGERQIARAKKSAAMAGMSGGSGAPASPQG